MLLAIDIGNSNVVVGLHNKNDWQHIWRIPTLPEESPLFYKMKIANHLFEAGISVQDIKKSVVSTVVPVLRDPFETLLTELLPAPPVMVKSDVYPFIQLKIDRPDEIGTDLVANAVAANHLFKKDCIVVDFGTALTFTIVNAEGHILGVNIAPGLKTAIKALFGNTAQLPEVPLEMPKSAVGKNTVTAIQSGIILGYVGLVKYQLECIRKEVGQQFIAVATGGLSKILTVLEEDFEVVDMNLTLEGLRVIGDSLLGD